jgi:hypothetical protein
LIWERNGPGGTTFTNRALEANYPKLFRPTIEFRVSKKRRIEVGWHSSPKSKSSVMGFFSRAVKHGELKIRSKDLVRECGEYVWVNGREKHESQKDTEAESQKGEAHGDRVIAAAAGWLAVREQGVIKSTERAKNQSKDSPPYGTLAWREKHHDDLLREENDPWDQRTTDDLASGGRFRSAS